MAQAASIPTTPSVSQIYLPIVQNGRHDTYVPESSIPDLSLDSTVNDVAIGRWSRVEKILCVDPSTGKCSDVSLKIASHALALALELFGPDDLPLSLREFAETHMGVNTVRAATLAAA